MEPTRQGAATLVDLLERILDKGILLNADIVICLADVPLIAISLRAVVASVETMLEYGFKLDISSPFCLSSQEI